MALNDNDSTMDGNSMDDLLDSTLDDLADMPEFKPLPVGIHRGTIKWDYSEYAKTKSIKLSFKVLETLELTDTENDVPVVAGTETSTTFFMKKKDGTKNEYSEGGWKNLLRPLAEHFATASNRETMDASQGCEVAMVTKLRKDKSDPKDIKYYTEFVSVMVA